MPQIIVTADGGAAFGDGAVTLRERVNVADFESQHFATQLVERLGWAGSDADQAEQFDDEEVSDADHAEQFDDEEFSDRIPDEPANAADPDPVDAVDPVSATDPVNAPSPA